MSGLSSPHLAHGADALINLSRGSCDLLDWIRHWCYRLLLEQAGFEFEAVTATPTPISIINALA
jgi:hypothetical protein